MRGLLAIALVAAAAPAEAQVAGADAALVADLHAHIEVRPSRIESRPSRVVADSSALAWALGVVASRGWPSLTDLGRPNSALFFGVFAHRDAATLRAIEVPLRDAVRRGETDGMWLGRLYEELRLRENPPALDGPPPHVFVEDVLRGVSRPDSQ